MQIGNELDDAVIYLWIWNFTQIIYIFLSEESLLVSGGTTWTRNGTEAAVPRVPHFSILVLLLSHFATRGNFVQNMGQKFKRGVPTPKGRSKYYRIPSLQVSVFDAAPSWPMFKCRLIFLKIPILTNRQMVCCVYIVKKKRWRLEKELYQDVTSAQISIMSLDFIALGHLAMHTSEFLTWCFHNRTIFKKV